MMEPSRGSNKLSRHQKGKSVAKASNCSPSSSSCTLDKEKIWVHTGHVKNLIESCFQIYMTKAEIVKKLHQDANVEPLLTDLVWKRLKMENHEFFIEYYKKLAVKKQIDMYNELLKRQSELLMAQSKQNEHIQSNVHYTPGSEAVKEDPLFHLKLDSSVKGVESQEKNEVHTSVSLNGGRLSMEPEMGVTAATLPSSGHFGSPSNEPNNEEVHAGICPSACSTGPGPYETLMDTNVDGFLNDDFILGILNSP